MPGAREAGCHFTLLVTVIADCCVNDPIHEVSIRPQDVQGVQCVDTGCCGNDRVSGYSAVIPHE